MDETEICEHKKVNIKCETHYDDHHTENEIYIREYINKGKPRKTEIIPNDITLKIINQKK